jgi:predicted amidohydrolase
VRVGALQYDTVWENPKANFERLIPWIDHAARADCELLVFPEMFSCGFTMNTALVAEPIDGPSTEFLRQQACRTEMWMCGSLPELSPGQDRPHNTLVLAAPDGTLSRYHKIHPFTFAGEDRHYQAGKTFTTVDVAGIRVTLFVCYDLRFADEFWHTAHQTDCYVVVANWPEPRRRHWRTLLRARAIENQAYVVGVNRIGSASGLIYAGDTAIVDPWGEALAEAKREETLIVATLQAGEVRNARRTFPFMADRRVSKP